MGVFTRDREENQRCCIPAHTTSQRLHLNDKRHACTRAFPLFLLPVDRSANTYISSFRQRARTEALLNPFTRLTRVLRGKLVT